MKIIYFQWEEFTYKDAQDVLRRMGHEVTVVRILFNSFDEDEDFIRFATSKVKESKCEVIFSFNYFPDISRVADKLGMPYVGWCFDSPVLTLESKTLSNSCNRIYMFDRALCQKYRKAGINTVYSLPLACNSERLEKQVSSLWGKYEHEITFLGKMYSDENDYYSQIKYLPDYVKGYVDCAMETQMKIYGTDMISELITHDMCSQIAEYAQFDMGPLYNECKDDVIRFMIQKHTTALERPRIMTVVSENFTVDHYASERSKEIKANYKGYADYMKEMPRIFATSKINLNITLRSIISGIPLRVIDILGSGGFCLTNYQSEIAEYFENDKSITWYESYEDLFLKLDWYLRHDSERERIAAKGHEIVARDFSYEKRFNVMFAGL